jgi:hypothetical protein
MLSKGSEVDTIPAQTNAVIVQQGETLPYTTSGQWKHDIGAKS